MVDVDAIRAYLAACTSTDQATAYVGELALSAPALRTLADALGVFVPGRAPKADVVRDIVRFTVGMRTRSQVLSRSVYAR